MATVWHAVTGSVVTNSQWQQITTVQYAATNGNHLSGNKQHCTACGNKWQPPQWQQTATVWHVATNSNHLSGNK